MEYKELIEKYGDERVKFSSYFKYSFHFRNDNGFLVSVGGIADEVYAFEVIANKEYTIKELEPNYVSLNKEYIYNEI